MSATKIKICLIITGGTTLYTPSGNVFGIREEGDIKPWIDAMPELALLSGAIDIRLFYGGDATSLAPDIWLKTAEFIYTHRAHYAGFVIISGPENIPYFSQAVSLMLSNVSVPVVFTGSLLPDYLQIDSTGIDEVLAKSKDVGIRANLINALQVIYSKINGTYVMFADRLISGQGLSYQKPFAAIPFAFDEKRIVGKVEFNITIIGEGEVKSQESAEMSFDPRFETRVSCFELNPLFATRDFHHEVSHTEGFILRADFHCAVPDSFLKALDARSPRIPVLVFGRSHASLHHGLAAGYRKDLEQKGVFILDTLYGECLAVYLMWILGRTNNLSEIKKLLQKMQP